MDTLRALRVLGLTPGAGPGEIQGAWRDLARVWHPDRFAGDARLQKKAGENLQRINEAHEALKGYDASRTPKLAARVRESVAIILGMGELGDPPPLAPARDAAPPLPPFLPDAPIAQRNSVRILGLGGRRTGARQHRSQTPRRVAVIVVTLVFLVAAIALWYFVR